MRILFSLSLLVIALSLGTVAANAQGLADTSGAWRRSYELPWSPIKEKNVLWIKRVWRRINVYETWNAPLRNDLAIPPGQVFANILLNGVKTGAIKAYDDDDTATAQQVSLAHIDDILTCDPADLSINSIIYINYCTPKVNPLTAHVIPSTPDRRKPDLAGYDSLNVASCFFPQHIEYYDIREDWVFDKSLGQMVVRIKAIAPVAWVHGKAVALFWLRYPDIRRYLTQFYVPNANRAQTGLNWDEFFESRSFSSRITHAENLNLPWLKRHE